MLVILRLIILLMQSQFPWNDIKHEKDHEPKIDTARAVSEATDISGCNLRFIPTAFALRNCQQA